jgi:tetratricopeptide (TPR) repeat protein
MRPLVRSGANLAHSANSDELNPESLSLFTQAQFLVATSVELSSRGDSEWRTLLIQAVDLLTKAVKSDPKAGVLYRYLAEAQGLLGDYKAAQVSVQRAIQLEPMDCRAHALQGFLRLDSSRPHQATSSLYESLRCGLPAGEQRQVWLALFEFYRDQNRETEAIEVLGAWVESLPDDSTAVWNKASYLWSVGRADAARDVAVEALLAGDESQKLARIVSRYFQHRPAQEASVLQTVIAKFPLSHHRVRLVQCLRLAGRPDLALEHLRYIPDSLTVGSYEVGPLRSWLLFEMHRRADSLASLQGDALDPMETLLRAKILSVEGQWEEASKLLVAEGERVVFPPGSLILFSLDLLEEQRRYEEAIALLETPEAARLGELSLVLRRARFLKKMGLRDEAGTEIEQAIRGVERDLLSALASAPRSEHHGLRAQAEMELIHLLLLSQWVDDGVDEPAATEALERVLHLQPDHPFALNARAYSLIRSSGDLEQAEKWILDAVSHRPFSGALVDTLAWLRFQQGELLEARKLIKRALHYAPGEAELLEHQEWIEEALRQREALSP